MKIVLVSWQFPPVNAIAAVRIGKLARYLVEKGHQVRVLTAHRPEEEQSLAVEIGEASIERTGFLDMDRALDPRRWIPSPSAARSPRPKTGIRPSGKPGSRQSRWARLYRNLVFLPDRQVGWGRYLLPSLLRTLREFQPDLILASGPPFSSFLWVAIASRRTGVPWVAEFRDRWADDTYNDLLPWRRSLDGWLERRLVGSAAGIATVSEPWREFYLAKYAKPTVTVMNGYDPADFTGLDQATMPGLPLRLLHVGTIYRGRRDPGMLFRALKEGQFRPDEIRIVFYGTYLDWIDALARQLGIRDFIELHEPVPYKTALQLQTGADLLLLLQWNAPSENGNVPGKLFEYFAAGRPIVGLGPEQGVPARLIDTRQAGLFSNDPAALAAYLRARVDEKRRTGRIAALPLASRSGLTRDEQYARLEQFLEGLHAAPEQSGMTSRACRAI